MTGRRHAAAWIAVKVHPGAGKDVLVQLGPGRFEAWIKAKPVDGRANEAVGVLLRRALQIPVGHLKLVKGGFGRHKVFQVL